jgi:thiamine biosynthesis lipoprotein
MTTQVNCGVKSSVASARTVPRRWPSPATAPARPFEPDRSWIRIQRRAMACRFEITLDGRDARFVPAAHAALDLVDAIEAQLTVFRGTSELVHLNQHAATAPVPCDRALFALLQRCAELSAATDEAFDITTTPLSRCWGFLRRAGRLPSAEEIAAARAVVGMRHVALAPDTASVAFTRPGVELNLNAVGKGYALDRIAVTLRDAGVRHALLSAGQSSVLAIGGRDRGWPIDLVSSRRDTPLARVWLRDAALGTSGAGEQFVVVDGRRYGHVLDPRTGWPAEAVLSATVACDSAADADALSTAFLVAGPALADRFCRAHANVLALVTPDDDSSATFVIGNQRGAEVREP